MRSFMRIVPRWAVGIGGLLLGFSQGREYAEFIFGAYRGINDAVFNWYCGHNILGMWLTLGVIPVIYYVISKVTDTPVYSHVTGLIGFWTILLFYNGLGGHHIEWAPVIPFVKNLAIAFSIGMIIPVVAVLVNWLFTLRGHWNKVASSLPLIFIVISPGAPGHRARGRPAGPAAPPGIEPGVGSVPAACGPAVRLERAGRVAPGAPSAGGQPCAVVERLTYSA